MIPNYNGIAVYYDKLARLVFGNKLERAKKAHLNLIHSGSNILIIGGGSGSLLKHLDQLGLMCQVNYVEASEAMMRLAQQQVLGNIKAKYYQVDILDFSPDTSYDLVFTNFFFDQFTQQQCLALIEHLRSLSKAGTKLVYADFVKSDQIWDRFIVTLMYRFFRLVVGLQKVQLINHKTLFQEYGFTLLESKSIAGNIVSEVYQIK